MSRRCHCRQVLADPRFRLLPLAARGLLLQLLDVMASWVEPGALRLAGRALSLREVSLLVSATETEVETALETLVETGLINRAETDGALVLPVSAAPRRDGAARGGRPKRGETAEQARIRRAQGNLIMPIAGGAAETAETAAKPPPQTGSPASLASSAEGISELQQLGAELESIAGLDQARGLYDFRPIAAWVAAGIPVPVIRDTIAAIAGRPGYRDRPARSFAYFDAAVREAATRARAAAPPVVSDPIREAACRRFNEASERWRDYGMLGKPPVLADFLGETAHAA